MLGVAHSSSHAKSHSQFFRIHSLKESELKEMQMDVEGERREGVSFAGFWNLTPLVQDGPSFLNVVESPE